MLKRRKIPEVAQTRWASGTIGLTKLIENWETLHELLEDLTLNHWNKWVPDRNISETPNPNVCGIIQALEARLRASEATVAERNSTLIYLNRAILPKVLISPPASRDTLPPPLTRLLSDILNRLKHFVFYPQAVRTRTLK
ncbi:hypothetical protein FOZ61_006895 [Perkinsus olseni]|uniref:Uncharacterized protein n=1 Tax=Perkinsus olseni TaxID=32597 RepID=A0A7J6LBC2_PEROL|nr:hypothetical protein FOZ61_006895 [Perkinsus olseni]KAF4661555.1 hypothetical protein FOL46_005680 [Perkinsus olseni]